MNEGGVFVDRMPAAVEKMIVENLIQRYAPKRVEAIRPTLCFFGDRKRKLSNDYTEEQKAAYDQYDRDIRKPFFKLMIAEFQSRFPHVKIIVIPNGLHYCFIAQEELVYSEMRKFLLKWRIEWLSFHNDGLGIWTDNRLSWEHPKDSIFGYTVPMNIEFSGKIWFWRGPAPWFFVTVPEEQSRELNAVSGFVTYGWGMIPVTVGIGKTEWQTSLWPKDDRYIVPIKASVRQSEHLEEGDNVTVRLEVR